MITENKNKANIFIIYILSLFAFYLANLAIIKKFMIFCNLLFLSFFVKFPIPSF